MLALLGLAILLCLSTAVSLAVALLSLRKNKSKTEQVAGAISLSSAAISCSIYCYARIISGFTLSDWRVVFVLSVYAAAIALSILSIVDGNRKLKNNCAISK